MSEISAPRWVWMTTVALVLLLLTGWVFRLGNQASADVTLDDPVVWIEDGQRGQILQINGSTGEITARVTVGERGDSLKAIPSDRDAVFVNKTNGELGVIGAVSLAVDNAFVIETADGTVQGESVRLEGDLDVSTDAYVIESETVVVVEPGAGVRLPIPTPDGLGDTAVAADGRLLALTADGTQIGVSSAQGLVPLVALPDPIDTDVEPRHLARSGDDTYIVDPARRTVNEVLDDGELGPTTCVSGSLTGVQVAGNHLTRSAGVTRILVHDPTNRVLSVSEPARSECFEIIVDVAGTAFGAPVAIDGTAFLPNWTQGRIEVIDLVERTVLDSLAFSSRPGEPFELEVFDNAVWANEPQGPLAGIVTRRGIRQISKFESLGFLVEEGTLGEDEGDGAFIAGEEDGDGRAFGNTGDEILGDSNRTAVAGGDEQAAGGDSPGSADLAEQTGLVDPADAPVGVILEGIDRVDPTQDELLANFEFSTDTATVGEEVTFTDTSTGVPVSWNWDFGDGTGAEGPEVVKAWDSEGVFTVQLFVADEAGRQAQQSIEITVVAIDVVRPPVADFRFRSDTVETGEALVFQSESTGDPDTLEWDFGDGATASGGAVEHSFSEPGTYEVTLTASNEAGSDTTSATITVVDAVQPPQAIIGSFTTVLETGQSATLRSESTNSPTSVSWDFDDGSSATGSEVRHSWSNPGTYRVRLSVSNSAGSDSTFVDVVVQPRVRPPVARFGESALDAVVGQTLNFNDLSQNSPTRWSWEFGDGDTASGPNVSHAWKDPGVFTVTLTVRNDAGTDEVSKTVTIVPPPPDPPVASFTVSSAVVPVNSLVNFTDTSTNDPTEWSWDFGDGQSSSAQSPPHAFGEPGSYEVTLTASNAGGSSTTSQTIVVSDPPVASFTIDVDELLVDFTDTSTNGPTAWSWTFGDGETSNAQNPQKTYGSPGTYLVTLIAANEGGSSAVFESEVTVARVPNANFSTSTTGLSVVFTDTSTNGPTAYSWSFGDGDSSNSQNPSHDYASPGSYTVTLTASNVAGSDSATATVTVDFAPPIADFVCTASEGAVSCDGSTSAGAATWSWSPEPAGGQGTPLASYVFGSSGTYVITLTVENPSGVPDSTSKSIDVVLPNRPPEVTNPGAQTSAENDSVSLAMSATDPDGDSVTWTATGLPPDLSINSSTGLISGTLSFASAGSSSVSVTATDVSGLSDTTTFTWNVSNTNRPPTVVDPGDQTDVEGASVSLPVSGSDPDGDTLSWSAGGLPAGLTINTSSGVITGTITATPNTYNVTVTATDTGGLSSSTDVTWTVTAANNPPAVTNPGNQTNAEGNSVSLPITGSDPDGDTLTWSASGLPANLSINSGTGTISGNLTFTADGTYNVTVRATDPGSLFDEVTFTWTVTNTNRAPTVSSPGNQTNTEGDTGISVTVPGSDPDGDTLTWSATGLPAGLTINTSSGVITGTITATPNTYNVTVTATDTGGLSGNTAFTWTVLAAGP